MAHEEHRPGASRGFMATPPVATAPSAPRDTRSSSESVPAPPPGLRDPHRRKGRATQLSLAWRVAVPSGLPSGLPKSVAWPRWRPHTSGTASFGKGLLARDGHGGNIFQLTAEHRLCYKLSQLYYFSLTLHVFKWKENHSNYLVSLLVQ